MRRALDLLFWTAVAVSIVHYTDNYFSYDQFPQASTGPSPSRSVVGVSWFIFTAFGLAGYALFRRGQVRRASAFLALYSISGTIGIGHYSAAGMTDAVWWRQAHVIADIVLGLAVLGFAVWASRRVAAPRVSGAS
ncbi:MAG: hypothetical protein H0U20_01425 [Thermoleophilaceae bacterium]|nr:hypothetical protein [Thermoleophilaceae bacterium]